MATVQGGLQEWPEIMVLIFQEVQSEEEQEEKGVYKSKITWLGSELKEKQKERLKELLKGEEVNKNKSTNTPKSEDDVAERRYGEINLDSQIKSINQNIERDIESKDKKYDTANDASETTRDLSREDITVCNLQSTFHKTYLFTPGTSLPA